MRGTLENAMTCFHISIFADVFRLENPNKNVSNEDK